MNVRRSSAAVGAVVSGLLALGVPAAMAEPAPAYPAAPATGVVIVVPGVTFGGPATGSVQTATPGSTLQVAAGAPTRFTVGGLTAGATVAVTVDGAAVGSFTVGANGELTVGPFTFAGPGSHQVSVGDQTFTATVAGHATTGTTPTQLPHTGGGDSGTLAGLGAAFVLVGGGAVAVARRRKQA